MSDLLALAERLKRIYSLAFNDLDDEDEAAIREAAAALLAAHGQIERLRELLLEARNEHICSRSLLFRVDAALGEKP
jgi:hypothetical protein